LNVELDCPLASYTNARLIRIRKFQVLKQLIAVNVEAHAKVGSMIGQLVEFQYPMMIAKW